MEAKQPPTPPNEWHAITFMETAFARTHADFILRELFSSPDRDVLPGAREKIEQETRNLLYIERGAAIASWITEHARRHGNLPGHSGDLSDLKPATHEEMQLAMDRPGHASLGPKPGAEVEKPVTAYQLRRALERCPDEMPVQLDGKWLVEIERKADRLELRTVSQF